MGLYEHLAPVYDRIFPVNAATLAFIEGLGREHLPGKRLLDLGSATGGHALALFERGWKVRGIELSPELLALARRKQEERGTKVEFIEGDMRDLGRHIGAASVDLVLCLGNTLPHLGSLEEVRGFLEATRRSLAKDGMLLLQIVNFGLAGAGHVFPVSLAEDYRFERSYQAMDGARLAFDTRLDLGEKGSFSDRTGLLPLEPAIAERALREAGYTIEGRFADWNRSPFDPAASPYLILLAANPIPDEPRS